MALTSVFVDVVEVVSPSSRRVDWCLVFGVRWIVGEWWRSSEIGSEVDRGNMFGESWASGGSLSKWRVKWIVATGSNKILNNE